MAMIISIRLLTATTSILFSCEIHAAIQSGDDNTHQMKRQHIPCLWAFEKHFDFPIGLSITVPASCISEQWVQLITWSNFGKGCRDAPGQHQCWCRSAMPSCRTHREPQFLLKLQLEESWHSCLDPGLVHHQHNLQDISPVTVTVCSLCPESLTGAPRHCSETGSRYFCYLNFQRFEN